MKIALVWTMGGPLVWDDRTLEIGIGGGESMFILYARALAALGHDTHVYAPVPTHGPLLADGVHWHHVATAEWRKGYDVVVAFRTPAPLDECVAPVRAVAGIDQSCDALQSHANWNLLITISQHQTERYMRQHGVLADAILTSSAGVDWKRFSPVPQKAGCIYASTPERGLSHFPRLWPQILAQVPTTRLTVTSGFELYGFSPSACEHHGKPLYDGLKGLEAVTYTGPMTRSRYRDAMAGAAVLCYPSHYEEMCCIAALEAAACGTVIVTTNLAALAERVVDGETGYLVNGMPGEPAYDAQFVERVTELLTDYERRKAMGKRARELAQAHDYPTLAAQWVERFQAML